MDWNSYLGHIRQRGWFRNAIQHGRLASTFLLVGPDSIGKRTFAKMIAKTMLCLKRDPIQFNPCGACEGCVQVEAGTHPDLIQLAREHDKSALSIDQFIGPEENRMRQGLCYEIRMKPYSGRCKIAIVDDADTMGVEGANSLLKTLEEPPPGALIFLISTSLQRQLPTIRSRCQVVRFQSLESEHIAELALRLGIVQSQEEAAELAGRSQGTLGTFSILLDPTLKAFQAEMTQQLSARPFDFVRFGKGVIANVDSVGSESQAKRDRLKLLIDFAQQHFRSVLRSRLKQSREEQLCLDSPVRGVKRCLEAREHVDRMVNPATLVEAWAADLAACVETL